MRPCSIVDEPFAGLFTQGMVTHETYREQNGEWVEPAEVEIEADAGEPARRRLDERRSRWRSATSRRCPSPSATRSPRTTSSTTYGVDAARLFVLSDSPPERDVHWTEAGVKGAFKQTQRLWRLVCEIERVAGSKRPERPVVFGDAARRIRQVAHGALAKVEGEIERLRFNVCIATIYEFANALSAAIGAIDATPVADDLRTALAEAATSSSSALPR